MARGLVRRRQADQPDEAHEALGQLVLSAASRGAATDRTASTALTRRRLLALSGMATLPATAGVYGCGTDAETSVEDEVAILNDALTLELSLVAAYEMGAELLGDTAAEAADLFAGQEREHANALRDAIEEAGGIPVEPRSRRGYERMLRLDELDGADDFLRLAVDLEQTAIGGYNVAVPRLASPPLRRVFYSIASAEAAHVTVLLGELGEVQVPDAFVAGARA